MRARQGTLGGGGGGGGSGEDSDSDSDDEPPVVPAGGARVVRQPGDGSCLFHSLAYGLRLRSPAAAGDRQRSAATGDARALRQELEAWIGRHPAATIGGTALADWVAWDSSATVQAYSARMASGSDWGGAIEIAVCARLRGREVHVYEQTTGGGFARISRFRLEGAAAQGRPVSVLYGGRCHYDAIEIES